MKELSKEQLFLIKNLSGVQLGWLVGMVDGEGYVGIVKSADGRYRPAIDITNTDRRVVEFAAYLTGLGKLRSHQPSGDRKTNYKWYVQPIAEVFEVLSKLIPHLVSKRKKAEIVVGYCITKMLGMCDNPEIWYAKYKLCVKEENSGREGSC